MFPYYMLLIVPALYMIGRYTFRYQMSQGKMPADSSNTHHKALSLFFGVLLLLLSCRHETIGRDLYNYKVMFRNYSAEGLGYVFESWSEWLFRLYNWVIYQFTDNYQIYLTITALICVLPIAFVYNQDSRHAYLKIVVFVNMVTFIMLFSGLRQSIAMAVGMLAYQHVKEKRLMKFILWALAATFIHHSGFMVFFMYPLYHLKVKRNMLIVAIPLIIVTLVFNEPIFQLLSAILKENENYDSVVIEATGAYGSLVLFALFATFAYVITDEKKCDTETLGLRNFLLFSVLLQCFAPLHTLAMRMNYYYILLIPLALGKCLCYSKKNLKQLAQLGEFVICCYFTYLFVVSTYQSAMTGISTLDTIPYVPFWKGT